MNCQEVVADTTDKTVVGSNKKKGTKKTTTKEIAEKAVTKKITQKPSRKKLKEIKESILKTQTRKQQEKKLVKWRNKREPACREDGKYVCPVCLSRDELTILDYDCAEEGKFLFVIGCKRCNVRFKVKKKV